MLSAGSRFGSRSSFFSTFPSLDSRVDFCLSAALLTNLLCFSFVRLFVC